MPTGKNAASTRWRRRPPGANWGDFGADDRLGRLNLLTPERVLQAVREVREGLRFCLSLPLDLPGGNALNPRRLPPLVRPNIRNGRPNFNYLMQRDDPRLTDVLSDDLAVLHLQYSTQWDSFAHVGQLFDVDGSGVPQPVYYNGFRAGEHVVASPDVADAGLAWKAGGKSTSSGGALGIEHMAATGVQGRGVLIDLQAHFGPGRNVVGYEALSRVMQADGVTVEEGDMVCLHTGFAQALVDMAGQPDLHALENGYAVLDGRDERLLNWVTESGLSVLVADNYAVEAYPSRPGGDCCSSLPLHEHCLFKLGIHLGELWHLTPLAAWLREHARHRFLLTAPALRLPGAVGSPVTPVATV